MAQLVKSLPAMQETWVRTLGGTIPWKRERLLIPVFCLENSMDYTGHGVTKSQTRLSDFHFTSLLFPTPGALPDPGIEPTSPALTDGFFTTGASWEAPAPQKNTADRLGVKIS